MAIKKEVPERRSVTIDIPGRSKRYVQNLDQSHLSTILASIVGSKQANIDLSHVILKGGTVRAAARSPAGGDPWLRTAWSRHGPLRPGDEVINPGDVSLPARGAGKIGGGQT